MPKGILKKPGQKRKKNTRHIRFNPNYDETWSALHPDIENEFFEANIEERSNLMTKYLQGHLIANYKPSKPVISDEALDRAKAKLERAIAKGKIEPTIDIEAEALKYVTEKAKTAAEEEDQKYLAAVKKLTTSYTVAIDLAIFAKKVDSWNVCKRLLQDKEISELILYKASEDEINKYINNNLADIQDDPEAVAFREKRAEQTSAPDYFDKKWRKNHPKPTLEYGKADRKCDQEPQSHHIEHFEFCQYLLGEYGHRPEYHGSRQHHQITDIRLLHRSLTQPPLKECSPL